MFSDIRKSSKKLCLSLSESHIEVCSHISPREGVSPKLQSPINAKLVTITSYLRLLSIPLSPRSSGICSRSQDLPEFRLMEQYRTYHKYDLLAVRDKWLELQGGLSIL